MSFFRSLGTGVLVIAAVLCVVGLGVSRAQAAAPPSTQLSPAPLPLQGNCDAAGQSDERGQGMAVSTIACPGESNVALSFSYSSGANESCLYIDNDTAGFGHRPVSFFVPLNTAEEWQSFKTSAQSGTLSNSVQLVYGCNAERVPSPCGGTVSVPVKRNGQTATVIVTPQMTATYTCTALTGCGTWNLTKTTGSCPINGACGSSDGASLTQAPSADLCHAGTASAVTGSGPWSWSCQGQYGGITTQCTASQTPQGCEPNIQITGYGPCSAACGGGSRDVYRDDGCANSSTSSEACNTQACTCTSTGWIYDGAGP